MIIILAIAGMVLLIPLTLFLALFVENIMFLDTLLVSVLCTAWLWSAYHSSIQQRLNVSCIMLKKCPERFRALFE